MKYIWPFLLITLLPFTANAMSAPQTATGMRHLSVTNVPSAKEETAPAPVAPDTTEKAPALGPKALKPEDALKQLSGLTEWPYYTDLMTIGNDTAIDNIVHQINIDPGSVPPKGLFYVAKALSDRKKMEDAAFYFYAAQLRATFDMARFPAYNPGDNKKTSDKRTQDQIGNVPSSAPALINPHEPLSMLALSLGAPISRFAMADADRLDRIMNKVREWDLATPYAYLPDYDTSHAVDFKDWPALLTKTRNDYFTRVRQISRGLKTVQPVEPTPLFSQPK